MAEANELLGVDLFLYQTMAADATLRTLLSAQSEVQQISIGTNTAGTLTVTFQGQTTTPLAFNSSAATVQAALEALSTIGAGNVVVTGSSPVWTATFQGALALRNVETMQLTSSLTGGAGQGVKTTIQGGIAIYSELAPQGVNPPYVIMQFMAATDMNTFGAASRAFTRPLYIVKAVTQAAGFTSAGAIADRIDAALMGARGQTTNPSLVIQGCFREQLIRYTEPMAGGERINHLGGQYRLFVNKVP